MKNISSRLGKWRLLALFSVLMINSLHLSARSEADLKRDETSKPNQIIAFAEVKSGDHVLDFLGGGGYYTEVLSQTVGVNGKVVLQNNQAYMPYVGKELESRLAGGRLQNVRNLLSEVDDFQLGEAQFDEVFFVLGFHDLYFSDKNWQMPVDKVVPQIARSMKSRGRLLIIDHSAPMGKGSEMAQSLHRIESAFVVKELERFGFRLIKSSEILKSPNDKLTISVFDPEIKRKTDRFVMLFEKVN